MHQSERAFWAHATGPQLKRRAGLTGSCCRGAGHDEGEKDGSKGLPGQNFSKGLLSLFTRHGVHRARRRGTCAGAFKAADFRAHHRSSATCHRSSQCSSPVASRRVRKSRVFMTVHWVPHKAAILSCSPPGRLRENPPPSALHRRTTSGGRRRCHQAWS